MIAYAWFATKNRRKDNWTAEEGMHAYFQKQTLERMQCDKVFSWVHILVLFCFINNVLWSKRPLVFWLAKTEVIADKILSALFLKIHFLFHCICDKKKVITAFQYIVRNNTKKNSRRRVKNGAYFKCHTMWLHYIRLLFVCVKTIALQGKS